jgi:hypothetical protein
VRVAGSNALQTARPKRLSGSSRASRWVSPRRSACYGAPDVRGVTPPPYLSSVSFFRVRQMVLVGVLVIFLVAALGGWVVMIVATGEGANPGCVFPIFASWGLCFLGLEEVWLAVPAFAGLGAGVWLAIRGDIGK